MILWKSTNVSRTTHFQVIKLMIIDVLLRKIQAVECTSELSEKSFNFLLSLSTLYSAVQINVLGHTDCTVCKYVNENNAVPF